MPLLDMPISQHRFFLPVIWLNNQFLSHLLTLTIWLVRLVLSCRSFVSEVITGYLPSLILQLFLYFIPRIMKMLSSIQGYISMSDIVRSACSKVLWFTIWNIFFANVLSGSALYQVNLLLEPKEVPRILALGVPGQVKLCSPIIWYDLCSRYQFKSPWKQERGRAG